MHWTEAIQKLEQLKADIPKITGNELVNFALDNLRKQSWQGIPWAKRKPGSVRNEGRALLVDTGAGRRSIRSKAVGNQVDLMANDYMQAHNEGATIRGNHSVRAHTRVRKGRSQNVRSHQRNANTTLPERRFTGKSTEQTARIEKVIAGRIVKALT